MGEISQKGTVQRKGNLARKTENSSSGRRKSRRTKRRWAREERLAGDGMVGEELLRVSEAAGSQLLCPAFSVSFELIRVCVYIFHFMSLLTF